MLYCENLTVKVGDAQTAILDSANATFMPKALNAVIGPSGCGKTTLMKSIVGILEAEGEAYYGKDRINGSEDLVGKVGFAPQFSIAQPKLSVEESIQYTLDLYVKDASERKKRLEQILELIGLAEHRAKRVESLSGGQLRRLGLGLELTLDPECMICDEVTSGLDPLSEHQILELLRDLSRKRDKTFVCIIHNLAKLNLFDFITVVYQGDVVFQGNLEGLLAYFEIPDALGLYDKLNQESLSHWREKWEHYNQKVILDLSEVETAPTLAMPSMVSQLVTLLRRRGVLFFRDSGYFWLTLAITFGFPCLVVIFALGGLPEIEGLALERSGSFLDKLQEDIRYQMEAFQTASLVTGLIMFQVILLTLMGSNNGAREIAGERILYEKERLSGLRVEAYGLSKIIFVLAIAFFQGLWMTFFVKMICHFPGSWLTQVVDLAFVCGSMTLVCLGFSAIFRSAEKASILSIYMVGFQLPLSGVVLALPDYLVWFCRPFINAYWGWAGYLSSMKDTRLYDAFQQHEPIWLATSAQALVVLVIQGMVGVGLVFWGCHRKYWNA